MSQQQITPWTGSLEEGTYQVTIPESVIVGNDTYAFNRWEDGTTTLSRTISLTTDITIVAYYEKVIVPPPTHILAVQSTPIQTTFGIERVA